MKSLQNWKNLIENTEVERQIQEYKNQQKKVYDTYHKEQKNRKRSRKKKAFESLPAAMDWMQDHPMFWDQYYLTRFHECFIFQFVLVNPRYNTIYDDKLKNTKLQCWLECGPYVYATFETTDGTVTLPGGSHDYKLDCGADTFEQAIMILVQKIYQLYGDYKS